MVIGLVSNLMALNELVFQPAGFEPSGGYAHFSLLRMARSGEKPGRPMFAPRLDQIVKGIPCKGAARMAQR